LAGSAAAAAGSWRISSSSAVSVSIAGADALKGSAGAESGAATLLSKAWHRSTRRQRPGVIICGCSGG
jgi:hypothetical protein